jgi:hypothetical protein
MPRLDTVLVLLLAMPAATFANSDTVRNTAERQQDHRQLAIDRTWAVRDANELREFEAITASLKDALQDRMSSRYRDTNETLLRAMDREIEQASVKAAQAAHAARVSRRQARNENMEATAGGNSVLFQVWDANNVRDTAVVRRDEMARIGTMAGALQNEIGRGDRSAMKRNLALAEQFVAVMRRDLAATGRETTEDRAELREDRKDRR